MAIDLDKIVKGLKTTLKSKSLGLASSFNDELKFISTGNLALDLAAEGGIPFGYVIEFLGLSQSGKSLYIQQIIAEAQKKYGAIGVLADRENAYTPHRGDQLGIDNSKLIKVGPMDIRTVNEGFLFLLETIKSIRKSDSKVPIVAAIDSIAAFGKDVSFEKTDPGRKAKSTHEGLREVISLIDKNIVLLVANQVTYKIGVLYGNPETSSAGTALQYYSNVRFALEDRKKIIDTKRGNEVIGNWLGAEVIKTRLGPCYRDCYLSHLYETGIDYYSGYARLLAKRGYLRPKNKKEFNKFTQSTLIFNDPVTGEESEVSEHRMEKFLEKHPELLYSKYPEYNVNNVKEEEEEEE